GCNPGPEQAPGVGGGERRGQPRRRFDPGRGPGLRGRVDCQNSPRDWQGGAQRMTGWGAEVWRLTSDAKKSASRQWPDYEVPDSLERVAIQNSKTGRSCGTDRGHG